MENAYMEQLSRSEMVKQMRRGRKVRKCTKYGKVERISKHLETQTGELEALDSKSFQLRIVLASLLFLLFLGMKEKGLQFQDFTYYTVIEVISDNSGMDMAVAATKSLTEEFVITTFNSLH